MFDCVIYVHWEQQVTLHKFKRPHQQPQTTNCRLINGQGASSDAELEQAAATDASSVLSASRGDGLRRHETTLHMKAASQGRTIGPALGSPNTFSDILRSSVKTSLLRNASGTSKRCPSLEYTTKKPFLAWAAAVQAPESSAVAVPPLREAILFLPAVTALSHFLDIWASLLELIILFFPSSSKTTSCGKRTLERDLEEMS
ncbi:hypothetical protein Taro_049396 [Colocasia esculenta]|uniref:Uncharacterized protein n=1 Tax=Colocasia esculenta TaxID=4460 RepID=A0A843XAS8_COLES|nr:hypothetical protein [Colocasia esculenta]